MLANTATREQYLLDWLAPNPSHEDPMIRLVKDLEKGTTYLEELERDLRTKPITYTRDFVNFLGANVTQDNRLELGYSIWLALEDYHFAFAKGTQAGGDKMDVE